MLKMRIKANNRRRRAELGKSDKECGSIYQYARQTNLLGCEETGEYEERSNKAHRHPNIGDDGALKTLFGDDTHFDLLFSNVQFTI